MSESNGWPTVPLGEVATHRKEFVQIDELTTYKRCRVQLHAQGIVLRDEIEGALIKTKSQQVCRRAEFLVAEIDAKVGGFGVVPSELDGAIVSSHYFLFSPKLDRLDPRFLDYFSKTPFFRDQVNARGSTNYAAIRPEQVLRYTIPLPPLAKQRRIVAKIDSLAAKIDEARTMNSQLLASAHGMYGSCSFDLFARQLHDKVPSVPLGDVASIISGVTLGRELSGPQLQLPYLRVANVQDGYLDLTVMKEIFIRADEEEKWKLESGDLLLTEGGDWDKLGRGTVWQNEIPNCIHQNHIFRVRLTAEFDPWYMLALTRSPYGKEYFQGASKQTTNLASINQRQLKAFPVYRVTLREQGRIVAHLDGLQAKVDQLKRLQEQSAAQLDALLPAFLDRAFQGQL